MNFLNKIRIALITALLTAGSVYATIESVTYISDFDNIYPANTDAKSEGDDHIRNIKTGILNTFPNITGAVTSTHTELNYVDVTAGTAAASKALVLDANRDIATVRNVTSDGTIQATTFNIGGTSITSTAAELNYNDITTLGTVEASKTVTADANRSIINTGQVGINLNALPSNAIVEIEDGGTTKSILLKITQDDENLNGVVVGNDTYSTTDTDGLKLNVENAGVSTVKAAGTSSILALGANNSKHLYIANNGGIYTPNATGTSKGADSINAQTLYENNVRVLTDGAGTVDATNLAAALSPWVEIDSVSISSATSLATLTGMDSTYDTYMVVGWNIQRTTAAGTMNMQVQVSGTSQTTRYWSSNGDTNNSALSICTVNNSSGSMAGFTMFIHAPSDTSRQKSITWKALTIESASSSEAVAYVDAGGAWIPSGASNAIDGVEFSVNSSGTFSLAEFRLYGLRK